MDATIDKYMKDPKIYYIPEGKGSLEHIAIVSGEEDSRNNISYIRVNDWVQIAEYDPVSRYHGAVEILSFSDLIKVCRELHERLA